jgi:predicted dehydrogenase
MHVTDADAAAAMAATDLVVVATDTTRHVSDALEALDSGASSVLVEKPLGVSVAQVLPLVEHPLAERIRVAAPLRGHHALRTVQALLPGRPVPRMARIVCQSWLPHWRPERPYRDSYSARADEGGVLRDLVHEIDYAIWLLGPPVSVNADLGHGVLGIEAEESADLTWRTRAGVPVSLRLDYVTQPPVRGLRLSGESGRVDWDALSGRVTVTAPDGGSETVEHPGDLDRDTVLRRQGAAMLAFAAGTTVEEDAAAPATVGEATMSVAVCDAARTADVTGCRTPLPVQASWGLS